MDYTTDEILLKLNLTQLKSLITLYGLEKPHSKSTKSDYITYIQSSDIVLDPRMLVNFFGLTLKQKKTGKTDMETITDDLSNVLLNDEPKEQKEKTIKKVRPKTPEKRRRSSKK